MKKQPISKMETTESFQTIYPVLKKLIKEGYGKRCTSLIDFNCAVCKMYFALDLVKEAASIEKEIEDEN